MKRLVSSGFTLIEVILFLAVAGVMLTAVIAGSGLTIASQRYRDSVSSLQSFFQEQYFEVSNPLNPITDKISCINGSIKIGGADSQSRGRSNCIILGKYITVGNPSNILKVYPVIGSTDSKVTGTDVEVFQSYTLSKISELVDNYTVEWSSRMLDSSAKSATFTVLIVKSPASGSIRTFINLSNNAPLDKTGLVNDSSLKQELLICMDDSNALGNYMLGVKINPGATNASAIEMIGDAVSKANGGCA